MCVCTCVHVCCDCLYLCDMCIIIMLYVYVIVSWIYVCTVCFKCGCGVCCTYIRWREHKVPGDIRPCQNRTQEAFMTSVKKLVCFS